MKILQLLMFPLWGSGSGTYTRKLSEKLVDLGEQVAIVCPEEKKLKGVRIFNVSLPFKVAFTGHPEWPNCKKYSELTSSEITKVTEAFWQVIRKAVEEFKPDMIHVQHASMLLWMANYIKAIYGIPYLVTSHGTDLLNVSLDKRYFALTKDALCRAHVIVCVSGDTRKWLLKIFSKKYLKKTRVITGGVDLQGWLRPEKIKIIDKKYNLTDKKVVIFSGKLTKPKGVKYLIKAAPKIKAEIFILGGGDEKKQLMELTKGLKLKNVHFLGYFGKEYVNELKEFYARADVVVVPSIWDEPLGLVVLEAMSSSTPVVASNKGGIPLAVKDNVNGFLVRARSAKAIAKAVNLILKNEKLQEKMGLEARRTVEEKFDWEIIAKRFISYYETAYKNAQKNQCLGKNLPYIDINREKVEVRSKKLDYR
ncbi:MAG: Glycosyl transferase group 1 [Berkelbacteria bacterium GW2011_GWA1_36_9]|uniref:Glycosyl transferase group 1 n=1 Tax=Berkelbacteria bacterium GW2011_GWA1_36_9 TaxID=1618331 RepID=A0A0G0FVR2_9BACT|nr:MAG: Glycosyl transferase group 1 [Berkelbacteria bacterium GW2011_GWA1_36_9]